MDAETKTSSSDKSAVRPFRVDVPEAELDDMCRRSMWNTRAPSSTITTSPFRQP